VPQRNAIRTVKAVMWKTNQKKLRVHRQKISFKLYEDEILKIFKTIEMLLFILRGMCLISE